jgi:hypothetical protein
VSGRRGAAHGGSGATPAQPRADRGRAAATDGGASVCVSARPPGPRRVPGVWVRALRSLDSAKGGDWRVILELSLERSSGQEPFRWGGGARLGCTSPSPAGRDGQAPQPPSAQRPLPTVRCAEQRAGGGRAVRPCLDSPDLLCAGRPLTTKWGPLLSHPLI